MSKLEKNSTRISRKDCFRLLFVVMPILLLFLSSTFKVKRDFIPWDKERVEQHVLSHHESVALLISGVCALEAKVNEEEMTE
jgi:hypothetical protein